MADLAIKGHSTRGKEVIEILEMLGGINLRKLGGIYPKYYYTIDNDGTISGTISAYLCKCDNHVYYTIEEFLEKFPYKIGDKVYNIIHNENQTITNLAWDSQECEIVYQTNNNEYLFVNYLQPYKEEKEEIMESKFIVDYVKESDNRYRIVLNHEFDMEVDEGEYYAVRRKPQYPKTYKECCKIVDYHLEGTTIIGYEKPLLENFQKLLICRDAYWKIAGEEIGLGKPWKPDWKDDSDKYFICYLKDELWMSNIRDCNRFLVFPTEEMRNAFFENFKELIEIVKELL